MSAAQGMGITHLKLPYATFTCCLFWRPLWTKAVVYPPPWVKKILLWLSCAFVLEASGWKWKHILACFSFFKYSCFEDARWWGNVAICGYIRCNKRKLCLSAARLSYLLLNRLRHIGCNVSLLRVILSVFLSTVPLLFAFFFASKWASKLYFKLLRMHTAELHKYWWKQRWRSLQNLAQGCMFVCWWWRETLALERFPVTMKLNNPHSQQSNHLQHHTARV